MKKAFLLFALLFIPLLHSTAQVFFDCQLSGSKNNSLVSSIGDPFYGVLKPIRTDSTFFGVTQNQAYFPVLIVFAEFQDDGNVSGWAHGSAPTYLDSMIASPNDYSNPSDWWNAYSFYTQTFSAHWMEVSRGKLQVLGKAYYVLLSHNATYYSSVDQINREIWDNLIAQGLTNWKPYDKWKDTTVGGERQFKNSPDGNVDMIYKIHKSNAGVLPNATGYADLGGSLRDTVDPANQIFVQNGYDPTSSGLTVSFGGTKLDYIGSIGHEHGHYTYQYWSHMTYSRVSYGFGFDAFYSPGDMVLNNYMTPTEFTFASENYALGDFSARNSGPGNILTVPVQGEEFFMLTNRGNISPFDRTVLGDTGSSRFYNTNPAYNKGLYVHHVVNGIHFPEDINDSIMDLESADGYWEWTFTGRHYRTVIPTCYQSGDFAWKYFKKSTPIYTNDPSAIDNPNPYGDIVSFHYKTQDTTWPMWWWSGKKETNACSFGTERLYTIDTSIYTSNNFGGTRFDAWRPGYNEVFSPYSSPSSCAWNNDPTGIFIWYHDTANGEANLKIWKASEYGGNTALANILEETPPSRPMGIKLDPCYYPGGSGLNRIKISWVHNMEPDMERGGGEVAEHKRYKIFRSISLDTNLAPPDAYIHSENIYTALATVDIPSGVTPSYIDTNLIAYCNSLPDAGCPPTCWQAINVRYRIQAVDIYDDVSVLSDWAGCRAYKNNPNVFGGGGNEDPEERPGVQKNIPAKYALEQNYPNPFNPETNIKYDLPKDGFVSIIIYDVVGREMMKLVNEYKIAGSYIIGFNASSLPSGVYFYKISSNGFTDTKKMMLIK